MKLLAVLLVLLLPGQLLADGPYRANNQYFGGAIGSSSTQNGIEVFLRLNNSVARENQRCGNFGTELDTCSYLLYGISVFIHNHHNHDIRMTLHRSYLYDDYVSAPCHSQILWILDEQKQVNTEFRIIKENIRIKAGETYAAGAIDSRLQPPNCAYEPSPPNGHTGYPWDASAYQVSLAWTTIEPPPEPEPEPPPSPPEPEPEPPPPPPDPEPEVDPLDDIYDELDRLSARLQEIAMRSVGDDYSDAEYCRDMTEIVDAYRTLNRIVKREVPQMSLQHLVDLYEQTRREACDRSNWDDPDESLSDEAGNSDSTGNGSANQADNCNGVQYPTTGPSCVETIRDDIAKPIPRAAPRRQEPKMAPARLKKPCPNGLVSCEQDP